MKYNLQNTISQFLSGEKLKFLFFWGHQARKEGVITQSCLSQWFEYEFEAEGIIFKTAEHWMMAEKAKLFGDEEMYTEILKSDTPGKAKALGRKVRNFDQKIWEENRFEIVKNGNLLKFSQNEKLKDFLLTTGNKTLVEASPFDRIWGIGMSRNKNGVEDPRNWKGLNLLGYVLMEVRDELI